MRRSALRSLLVAAVLGCSSGGSDAGPVAGWSAGPDADATMAVGQIFKCEGEDCAGGFTCLHAAAPPRPPGARWLKIEDVTSETVWPWLAVETWLGTKLNEIRPGTVPDPSLPVGQWASKDDPITFDLDGEGFARRVYSPYVRNRDLSVPIWFWTSKGRLFTLFCAIENASLADVRDPIHRLLSDLHVGEPVRDDIPTRF